MGESKKKNPNQKKRQRRQAAKQPKLPKETAAQKKIRERRDLAWNYRLSGASLRFIARLLTEKGYQCSHETVREDLEIIIAEKRQSVGSLDDLVLIEAETLNAMQLPFWSKAMKGDVNAGWLVLAISKDRREMLGYDKPKKVDVKVDARETLAKMLGVTPENLPNSES